jgi:hypothetical protein
MSASLSWCQAPFWAPTPDFCYCQTLAGFLYGAPSLSRGWICRLQRCWPSPAQSFSGPSPAGLTTIFLLPPIRDSPNLEGQVPVFISPRNRVAQLFPQALGSLFVASRHSEGYGGGIGTRLHTGWSQSCSIGPRYIASGRTAQKTPLPTVLVLRDLTGVAEKCLLRRHIATDDICGNAAWYVPLFASPFILPLPSNGRIFHSPCHNVFVFETKPKAFPFQSGTKGLTF